MPAHHIYETLFAWGADFAPKPMLAESYAISPDRKTWTIRLRRGVKFHNGKEMTADDVVASIDRWRKVSSIGRGWTDVKHEKADPYTIRLSSDQPRGVILSDFASTSVSLVIMPKEVADGAPANELKQYVGTGPFQFDALVPDQVVRLKAFRNYVSRSDPPDGMRGAKRAMVETLEFRIIKEPATRVAALQSGEVHIVPSVQASDRRTLRNDSNITLTLLNPYQWWGFGFNFTRALAGNLKIRQAIQAGIDHAELALASAGEQDLYRLDPALSVVGTFYYSDVGKELFNQKDRAKARRLLQEAGYNNEPIVIVSTKANIIQDRMATVLHKQLEEMGMRVQTDWYDGATLRQVRTQRDRWDIIPVGWGTVFDPNVYSQNWHSRSGSWGWYNNREMDLAMDSAARSVDLNVRKRHYANMQRIFVNDIPMLKVFDLFSLRAARRSVQNVSPFKDLVVWNATVTR
jgi:peptide/nickel transport system substrate-binding protein